MVSGGRGNAPRVLCIARSLYRQVFKPLWVLEHGPLADDVVVLRIIVHAYSSFTLLRTRCARVVDLAGSRVGPIPVGTAPAIPTKASFMTSIRIECLAGVLLLA